ncbi:hypothetical protein B0H19DRAFT_204145 [Mycena capillaripes]|nr:hypothetical protein B0H19DRAFT_204145 [Mycena capillaripes]
MTGTPPPVAFVPCIETLSYILHYLQLPPHQQRFSKFADIIEECRTSTSPMAARTRPFLDLYQLRVLPPSVLTPDTYFDILSDWQPPMEYLSSTLQFTAVVPNLPQGTPIYRIFDTQRVPVHAMRATSRITRIPLWPPRTYDDDSCEMRWHIPGRSAGAFLTLGLMGMTAMAVASQNFMLRFLEKFHLRLRKHAMSTWEPLDAELGVLPMLPDVYAASSARVNEDAARDEDKTEDVSHAEMASTREPGMLLFPFPGRRWVLDCSIAERHEAAADVSGDGGKSMSSAQCSLRGVFPAEDVSHAKASVQEPVAPRGVTPREQEATEACVYGPDFSSNAAIQLATGYSVPKPWFQTRVKGEDVPIGFYSPFAVPDPDMAASAGALSE